MWGGGGREMAAAHQRGRLASARPRKPRNQQLADIARYDFIVHHHRIFYVYQSEREREREREKERERKREREREFEQ